ncbi:Major capsid protein Gp5 [uncultured Caudovirales phage]|uniref:Major capsid protein Gp5 n=1 Tax=uncultured Caudovirales phage TaxID=2100421 RepID=A0A6J5L5F9_9CAUD|nr:Major capsid protein Gp5 [uncultured Caudovirales phage]
MPNQFITTDLVSNTALAMFANNAPFVMTASRIYQDDFVSSGYKIGDTLQVRRQNHFIVGDGSVATPQSIIETVETIVIAHQYHALIAYTIQDLSLRIEDFSRLFIAPAIQEVITQMEKDIGGAAEQTLNFFTGTAGVAINSFTTVDTAGAKLLEQGVNIASDAYLAMTVRDGSSLKGALLNNFTPVFNEDIVRSSAIGHLSYFDIFQSQNIKRHTAGAGPRLYSSDALLVNGAVSSGNTIVMDGATINITNYFVVGDVISIAGVDSVNPVGRGDTGQNMQWVITANASSDNSGNITITVSPSIISDTSNPNQNVTNAVPDNAAVTMVGSHNVNVAYPSRGLDIVCPPLYKLQVPYASVAVDPETGLSLAVTQTGDILGYQNYMRIDLLCGFAWHQQYAVRVLS